MGQPQFVERKGGPARQPSPGAPSPRARALVPAEFWDASINRFQFVPQLGFANTWQGPRVGGLAFTLLTAIVPL